MSNFTVEETGTGRLGNWSRNTQLGIIQDLNLGGPIRGLLFLRTTMGMFMFTLTISLKRISGDLEFCADDRVSGDLVCCVDDQK